DLPLGADDRTARVSPVDRDAHLIKVLALIPHPGAHHAAAYGILQDRPGRCAGVADDRDLLATTELIARIDLKRGQGRFDREERQVPERVFVQERTRQRPAIPAW